MQRRRHVSFDLIHPLHHPIQNQTAFSECNLIRIRNPCQYFYMAICMVVLSMQGEFTSILEGIK